MSFCFNFDISQPDQNSSTAEETDGQNATDHSDLSKTDETVCEPGKEVFPDELKQLSSQHDTLSLGSKGSLDFVLSKQIEDKVLSDIGDKCETSNLKAAIKAHSDLLPHVYEGGLKIWECSVDLVNFLAVGDVNFKRKTVLELGCGAGLPGIFAAQQGAVVHFQDYNEAVIKNITIPNIKLNQKSIPCGDTCRFFSGDWTAVEPLLRGTKYDFILTSETIYSEESYDSLHSIMSKTLHPEGVIYLAAKTYYFGVGGGLRSFEKLLQDKGIFHSEVCKEYSEGVNREILRLTFKH